MSAVSCLSYSQCINWNAGCFLSEERRIYFWCIVTKLPKIRKLLTTNVSLFNLHCCAFVVIIVIKQRCFFHLGCFYVHFFHDGSTSIVLLTQSVPLIQWEIFQPQIGKSQPLALLKWSCWVFSITIHSKSHNTFLCSDTYQNKYQKSYTLYSLFLSKHFPH